MNAIKRQEDWEKTVLPMTTVIKEEDKESYERLISHPQSVVVATKKLVGFKTYTLLDEMFRDKNGKDIDGIPVASQVGITGLPSSGKSIFVQESAVQVAHNGKKVLLATSEDQFQSPSPRFDVQARLAQKAEILKLDWKKIKENLIVLDTVTNGELRTWETFAKTYRHAIETRKVELVLIDTVTLLESYRGALKYRLQELCRYNQIHGITGIFVSQRAKEEWDVREMAGGIGLGHILDCTVVIDYGKAWNYKVTNELDVKRGTFVRIFRVLGCRLCGFDGTYHEIRVTPDGLLRRV